MILACRPGSTGPALTARSQSTRPLLPMTRILGKNARRARMRRNRPKAKIPSRAEPYRWPSNPCFVCICVVSLRSHIRTGKNTANP
ncbi:hypothetical protein BO86DRAFT_67632 [Aspergillus japonicus CBS 114.51]|uniref:Uncharacterized protein n=2 Tax=Aspergillus TaxID=5052 RepID=A0A2V5IQT0_ASPV1|nr:hypothetical protein BO86DRAFT_67632 [Aspergillus japonicus CBS 114.51]PYI22236.1 hypothetical protein BO99DRAFT_17864 [Aspergillus violaceofuscus CBS 115571]RAH82741.1 hypothetical protein BO86DRAFT_67632 [Aspergillus japonicus CBS 114.51]